MTIKNQINKNISTLYLRNFRNRKTFSILRSKYRTINKRNAGQYICDCKNEKKKKKERNTLETNSKTREWKRERERDPRSIFIEERNRSAKQRPPFRLNVHPKLLITCLRYPGRCASDRTSQHPSRAIFIPAFPPLPRSFHFSTLLRIFLHFPL